MTPRLACPFCYSRIKRRSDLWFLCRGRATAHRPACRPVVDEARRNLTGFSQPTLPAFPPGLEPSFLPRQRANCPHCGGESTSRACPECHTQLPSEFGVSASPLVAMVGATGTGKTVYLTVLSKVLQSPKIRREFQAVVHPIGQGQEGFSQAHWVRENIEHVFHEGRLFEASAQAVNGRKEPLVLEWRGEQPGPIRRHRQRTNYLSFYDSAGEDLAGDQETRGLHYLRAANYLILLLDPFQLNVAQHLPRLPRSVTEKKRNPPLEVLARITETLKQSDHWNGRRITVPIAVAFAKMDAFYDYLGDAHPLRTMPPMSGGYDETVGRSIHEHVAALLNSWGGGDINDHLQSYYKDFRYFFVSALGAEPDYEHATVNPLGVRPDRVEEPLLWLLSKEQLVPRTDR